MNSAVLSGEGRPAPPWKPPLDSQALRELLAKVQRWEPFDADALLEDVGEVLDDVTPPADELEELAERLGGNLTPPIRIGPDAGADEKNRHAGRLIARVRQLRSVGCWVSTGRPSGICGRARGRSTSCPSASSPSTASRRWRRDRPSSPYPSDRRKSRSVLTPTGPGIVPFITQREGEDAAPDNLILLPHTDGRLHLHYLDEDPRDRDLRGVLWARCSFNTLDAQGQPTGRPQWKLMHPYRQMMTMQALRCQICTAPARTPLGLIFLAGAHDHDPTQTSVLTNQPPVCARHVRAAARLCPHLDGQPTVFLAQSAPLYGVTGTLYGLGTHGVQPVAQPGPPLPYGHPDMTCFLASQQIRRLSSFRTLTLDELLHQLRTHLA